jgi:hypothetical protein
MENVGRRLSEELAIVVKVVTQAVYRVFQKELYNFQSV